MIKWCFSAIVILTTVIGTTKLMADNNVLGERLAWSCFSCHGVDGASQGPATPVIAGLSYNYIVGAMLSYKHADDLDKALDVVDDNPDLEDVSIHKRFSAIMKRVAGAYSLNDIKAIAEYYSGLTFVKPTQDFAKDLAADGKKLHKKYCDKCHEDWGTSTEDDVGLLAGQWKQYLTYTMQDFQSGDRSMHKKMKKKMKKMLEKKGDESITQLIEFYSSQR